jgi:hypothetical protein
MWADVGGIMRMVFDNLESFGKLDKDEAKLIETLGLRDVGVMSMNLHCDEAGSRAALRLDWTGDGWIPRLSRQVCRPGTFRSLAYVPADCRGVQALQSDPAGLFDAVVKMLIEFGELSPADLVEGLTDFEAELGFNPREDLLELLDGELVFMVSDVDQSEAFPFTPMDPINFAAIMGLVDGEEMRTLVDGVIRRMGLHVGLRSEEFLGYMVTYLPLIPGFSLYYAILDDMVVVSMSPTMVHDVLRRRSSADLPSMRSAADFRQVADRLQGGYGLLGYSDSAAELKSALRMLKGFPEFFGAQGQAVPGELAWLAQMPWPEESVVDKYFSGGTASALTIDETGLMFESIGP